MRQKVEYLIRQHKTKLTSPVLPLHHTWHKILLRNQSSADLNLGLYPP